MNVKATDIPKQQQFFSEYWNVYKKYYGFWEESETDKIWDMIITETDLLCNSYKDSDFYQFARGMLLEMINEFERKCRKCQK